jgi:hypothetical protein
MEEAQLSKMKWFTFIRHQRKENCYVIHFKYKSKHGRSSQVLKGCFKISLEETVSTTQTNKPPFSSVHSKAHSKLKIWINLSYKTNTLHKQTHIHINLAADCHLQGATPKIKTYWYIAHHNTGCVHLLSLLCMLTSYTYGE